jgi:hypothetical protein
MRKAMEARSRPNEMNYRNGVQMNDQNTSSDGANSPDKQTPLIALKHFSLGQILATPNALALMEKYGVNPIQLIARQARHDWGDCCAEDAALNEAALSDGSRLMSVYRLGGDHVLSNTPREQRGDLPTIWIITNAEDDAGVRDCTTLLLPEDY